MSNPLIEELRSRPSLIDRQEAIDEAHRGGLDLTVQHIALDGIDLSGLWLTPLSFVGVDFRGCVCRGATLPPLTDCILDGVDARDSCIARLERCRLRQARLDGVCLGGRIVECDFTGGTLRSGRIEQILTEHRELCEYRDNSFANADMRDLDAAGGHLVESSFRGANLAGARLSRANLSKCDLRDANFAGANIVRARLHEADVTNAKFEGCTISTSVVRDLERGGCPVPNNIVIPSYTPGQATAALERELEPLGECDLLWDFVRANHSRREALHLWRESRGPLRIGISRRRNAVRIYPFEVSQGLAAMMLDVVADYADWQVDLQSIRIEMPEGGTVVDELLRKMLAELFIAG